ncbi:MAG: cytochrome c3 family protein [Deltaproteobacteria bacterium]|nr:cytochrome c3 family protein [Deltaproteobacteria bacterium]
MKRLLTTSFFLALGVALSSMAYADEKKEQPQTQPADKSDAKEAANNAACLECHGDKDSVEKKSLVDGKHFAKGPHTEDNGVTCVSCHVKASKVEDITDHGKLGKASCTECHEAAKHLAKSVHALPKKGKKAPSCVDCHGEAHQVVEAKDIKSPVHRNNLTQTCAKCHKGQGLDNYAKSVHGQRMKAGKDDGPTCATCHGAHDAVIADVAHNAGFKVQMVKTCGKCHDKEAKLYLPSAHGKALMDDGKYASASCVDCHLGHEVLTPKDSNSSVFAEKTVEACGRCHGDERMTRKLGLPANVVATYQGSFHGRAGKLGEKNVARCTSCHGVHAIHAKEDLRSWVHKTQLPKTCGKCHPGASENFVKAKIHVELGSQDNYWAHWVRNLYLWLIALVIGGMAVHNLMDWIRKNIQRAREQKKHPYVIRMTKLERVLHAMLAISFLSLCYTGFALIYPDQWWVAPMNWISNTESFRSLAHRIAGVILILVAVHHVYFIFLTKIGRLRFKHFLPKPSDVVHVFQNVMWMLGRRKERPAFSFFSYMEKAEYWALVWGTVLMILTGLVLWFEEISLQFMPLWLWEVCQVMHRFEAILAFAAIVVWHFYYVLVNPDESPMSLTFITGRMSMHELALAHPEEYAAEMERRRAAGVADEELHDEPVDAPAKADDDKGDA